MTKNNHLIESPELDLTITSTSPIISIASNSISDISGMFYAMSPNGNAVWVSGSEYSTSIPAEKTILPSNDVIKVVLDDGSYEVISRCELVKYICDRSLREQNEVIRTLWDRYTVAVKLVRSNDDGSNGS